LWQATRLVQSFRTSVFRLIQSDGERTEREHNTRGSAVAQKMSDVSALFKNLVAHKAAYCLQSSDAVCWATLINQSIKFNQSVNLHSAEAQCF